MAQRLLRNKWSAAIAIGMALLVTTPAEADDKRFDGQTSAAQQVFTIYEGNRRLFPEEFLEKIAIVDGILAKRVDAYLPWRLSGYASALSVFGLGGGATTLVLGGSRNRTLGIVLTATSGAVFVPSSLFYLTGYPSAPFNVLEAKRAIEKYNAGGPREPLHIRLRLASGKESILGLKVSTPASAKAEPSYVLDEIAKSSYRNWPKVRNLDEKFGFKDFLLEEPLARYQSRLRRVVVERVGTHTHTVGYVGASRIGSASVDVHLFFLDDKLMDVVLSTRGKSDSFEALQVLQAAYDHGEKPNRFLDEYWWWGGRAVMSFKKNVATHDAQISISSRALSDAFSRFKREANEAAADEL